jgi:hypothetical protein
MAVETASKAAVNFASRSRIGRLRGRPHLPLRAVHAGAVRLRSELMTRCGSPKLTDGDRCRERAALPLARRTPWSGVVAVIRAHRGAPRSARGVAVPTAIQAPAQPCLTTLPDLLDGSGRWVCSP